MTARPEPTLGADEREKFENWMSDCGEWPHAVERKGDSYRLAAAATAWRVWQARAALAAPAVVVSAEPVAAIDSEIERLFVEHGFIYHKCVELGRAILALATPVGPDAVDAAMDRLGMGERTASLASTKPSKGAA